MAGGLFQIENPMQQAMAGFSGAAQTLSATKRNMGSTSTTTLPEEKKTAGGALGAGLGGAAAGSAGGVWGAAAGAAIGIAGYFLS